MLLEGTVHMHVSSHTRKIQRVSLFERGFVQFLFPFQFIFKANLLNFKCTAEQKLRLFY